MSLTNIQTDRDALRITVTAHYDTPIDRVWQLWADPRLLERWWGPPTYPATFTTYNLSPGGDVRYYMTGPNGQRHGGWWRVIAVEAPHRIEFEDGFADADGNPQESMPTTTNQVSIVQEDDRVRMTIEAQYTSIEDLEQVLAMGAEEGLRMSIGQIDALLDEIHA